MKIYLIRHGQTIFNLEKKIQGRKNIPLCPAGIEEIKRWIFPEHLKKLPAFSSPLIRAIETAKLSGFDPMIESNLIEMDWGEGEGKKVEDFRKKYGDIFKKEEEKGINFNFFNAESPKMVQKRAWNFIKTLKKDSIIFTHKGVIRALYALATDWDMKNKPKVKLENNCIHSFNILRNNQFTIDHLNISLIK